MTDTDILNLAEDCGLMVEIEELESWEGMFAFDKSGLQKFARRILAEAQSCAEPVAWRYKHHHGYRDWSYSDNAPSAVATTILEPLYAAPQPIAAAQPTHLVRRGLRPDGTYPPADDDESVAATPEDATAWFVERTPNPDHPQLPRWLSGFLYNDPKWTDDPNKAIRFARKEDAEKLCIRYCLSELERYKCRPTEHVWLKEIP